VNGRLCGTPGCGRALPFPDQRYCRTCIGVVLRTGHEPAIGRTDDPPAPRRHTDAPDSTPEWLRRARLRPTGLARDLTETAA